MLAFISKCSERLIGNSNIEIYLKLLVKTVHNRYHNCSQYLFSNENILHFRIDYFRRQSNGKVIVLFRHLQLIFLSLYSSIQASAASLGKKGTLELLMHGSNVNEDKISNIVQKLRQSG